MFDAMSDSADQPQSEDTTVSSSSSEPSSETGFNFAERSSEILDRVNQTLETIDWTKVSNYAKIAGIFTAVIVAQILIKGVLDTINLLPIVPGLLELLGLFVVGQWSWKNLTTSDKRAELMAKIDDYKSQYLG